MLKEFKEFALKGNMVDMAVGIIIGGAFGGVVKSLVEDVIMPIVSLPGKINFSSLAVTLKGVDGTSIVLKYGNFVTLLINFLILAFVVFLMVKAVNKLRRESEVAPAAPLTTKECPFCATPIPLKAVRCPHCTSELKTVS